MISPAFVIDTNVILHDPRAHYSFKEGKVIIPIVVLEELDKFKSGRDQKAVNARQFIRDIETKRHKWIEIDLVSKVNDITVDSDVLKDYLNDNKILACAYLNNATLVTKDINLRMKAEAFNVSAQDYENGKVESAEMLYDGYREVELENGNLIDELYSAGEEGVEATGEDCIPNEYYVFKCEKHSAIARLDGRDNRYKAVKPKTVSGIKPKNVEQIFAVDALSNKDISLVALTGKAGTGKTLLSLASAIANKKDYLQIYISRPTVDMEREIGFLPGDIKEKLMPYMSPLYDNFKYIRDIQNSDKTKAHLDKLLQDGKIQIEALNYIRGRSLPRIFFIIDEAQNLTPHEIKTIITRAGEGTKIVFTGDLDQIDTPYLDKESNGLSYLIDKMKGQSLFAHIHLKKGERSELAELASDLL